MFNITILLLKTWSQQLDLAVSPKEFPGGPVVVTPCFHC